MTDPGDPRGVPGGAYDEPVGDPIHEPVGEPGRPGDAMPHDVPPPPPGPPTRAAAPDPASAPEPTSESPSEPPPEADIRRESRLGSERDPGLLVSLVVVAVAGAALSVTARLGSTPLLVAVAAVQALLAVAWVFGTRQPGRLGNAVIAVMAAAGTDTVVAVWPHGRLGAVAAVLGLTVPVMFVHQLARGAGRVRLVASLSSMAVLVAAEVALASYAQLRHEFDTSDYAGRVVAAATGAVAVAMAAGYLVDLVAPVPRFDPAVPRGVLAVVVSALVGAAFAYLTLRRDGVVVVGEFTDGRAAFTGAALGALAGLLSVGATFAQRSLPAGTANPFLQRTGQAVLPLCVLAPLAFLLCLTVRR